MAQATELAPDAHAVPATRVDFSRPVVCILGLTFDAIGMAGAVRRIREAAFAGRRCWVSTPNLNFAVTARADPAFRDSVLRCDLSLVDGMPLVWIARLLGLPVRERVAGSDLFEALQAHPGPPLAVYLFGGLPGAAAQASARINACGNGLRCVGFDEGGFGPIESMSDAATIARINESGAHFLVVAMGARKGQAWIAHNAHALATPVLCHLGAVMNFAAGTLRRAPWWARRVGLEWLWRIAGEPALWRRYWKDGIASATLLATRVLPDAVGSRLHRPDATGAAARLELHRSDRGLRIGPRSAWSAADVDALRAALAECRDAGLAVSVDLSAVTALSNAFAALLLLAQGWFLPRGGFEIVGAGPSVEATLRRMMVDSPLLDRKGTQ